MAKVLVVDDSRVQKVMMEEYLVDMGHQVVLANNGQEGIDLAKRERPDLILMDIIMPDINGFQAVRKIKQMQETKHIPVVMVSTKSMRVDKIWAERQGASDYITKPIDRKEFESKVSAFLPT